QLAYSEFIFLDKLWPEITRQDLVDCIAEYERRERRVGK
ncbi:undecaprenyl diphosphate synthase family protein, partial [Candidatus Woesearchaeota archaeon]|nr:undecaprenyl diphosphate synthase family protein [Candidatus Woesearchaeota archaeon]